MTLEAFIETAITTRPAIKARFEEDGPRPAEEWYFAQSSLGLGDNLPIPPRPYLVWNELTDNVHQAVRETSNSRNRNFQFFIYDHKGDFTRINRILEDLRDLVKEIAPFSAPDGAWCSDVLWVGISGQITDDGYDSSVRFASVRFTVNR